MQSESKRVDFKEIERQILFRRVLEHLRLEAQRTKKRKAKQELRQLKEAHAHLQKLFEQQTQLNASLQQTLDKQTQLLEQHGVSPRKASPASRLRTPSKRKSLPAALPSSLASVPESPQTQLAGSLSQIGLRDKPSSVISPLSSSSSSIPIPTVLRPRNALCLHGRSIASCALCGASPIQSSVTLKRDRSVGESAKETEISKEIGAARRVEMKLDTPTNNGNNKLDIRPTPLKTGVVRIHFEELPKLDNPSPSLTSGDVVQNGNREAGTSNGVSSTPHSSACVTSSSSQVNPQNSQSETSTSKPPSPTFSARTSSLLRAVSTAVRHRRISK